MLTSTTKPMLTLTSASMLLVLAGTGATMQGLQLGLRHNF
jgi:hypothetical protein